MASTAVTWLWQLLSKGILGNNDELPRCVKHLWQYALRFELRIIFDSKSGPELEDHHVQPQHFWNGCIWLQRLPFHATTQGMAVQIAGLVTTGRPPTGDAVSAISKLAALAPGMLHKGRELLSHPTSTPCFASKRAERDFL